MKAYRLHGINDIRYEDIEEPDIPEGWCMVKVKASGICSSDIPRVFTKGTYHFPTIPGHEFAGEVVSVNDSEHQELLGKSVGIFPLIPCRNCVACKEKKYEMCENYDYLGSRRDGGFAERVAVPIWNLIQLAEDVSMKEAAMLEPLAVALHCVRQAEIQNGESVAVVGSGMIGFAVAKWAKLEGATKVVVYGQSEAKRTIANAVDCEYMTLEEGSSDKTNYDVVIEAAGSEVSIDLAINMVVAGGKLVLMGNPAGDIKLNQNTYWRILRKQLKVIGTWNSSYNGVRESDWTRVRDALVDGSLNVSLFITHVFKQDELEDALELMREHKEMYCKVLVEWNE